MRAICELDVSPEQREYVAPNVFSIAQAYFEPRAWLRAVYANETPVGFVMLHEDVASGAFFLWRLMIDAEHQGKGYGRQALALAVERVRELGGHELVSSHGEGVNGPGAFYRACGFVETGEVKSDEVVIRLTL